MHWQRVEQRVGVITKDYGNYNAKTEIGFGGFGRVYEHVVEDTGKKVAVKKEERKVGGSYKCIHVSIYNLFCRTLWLAVVNVLKKYKL